MVISAIDRTLLNSDVDLVAVSRAKITIDSDWAIRGGKEQFRDWGGPDTW